VGHETDTDTCDRHKQILGIRKISLSRLGVKKRNGFLELTLEIISAHSLSPTYLGYEADTYMERRKRTTTTSKSYP